MHDFRYQGSPVDCSIDVFAAEIEPSPQSAGYTLPADPAVETGPREIASAVHQAVLHRIIMHVIEMMREIFVVFAGVLPESPGATAGLSSSALLDDVQMTLAFLRR